MTKEWVVAGTDIGHVTDTIQDLKLWAEAVIVQFLAKLNPLTIGMWNNDFISM